MILQSINSNTKPAAAQGDGHLFGDEAVPLRQHSTVSRGLSARSRTEGYEGTLAMSFVKELSMVSTSQVALEAMTSRSRQPIFGLELSWPNFRSPDEDLGLAKTSKIKFTEKSFLFHTIDESLP